MVTDTVNLERVRGTARTALEVFHCTLHKKAACGLCWFHTCHLCSEACSVPPGYRSGLRSSLSLGGQSNAQTDGEQKAGSHEGGGSVSAKSCRDRTHVHRTAPSLPNDQIPQSLTAPDSHPARGGEHSTQRSGELLSENHLCTL